MSDPQRLFPVPNKNLYASDRIKNLKAKTKYAGTVNLAQTLASKNGNFPFQGKDGSYKPYKGPYFLASSSTAKNGTYCINSANSHEDLLDITKGRYLVTPPYPARGQLTLNTTNPENIYNAPFFANDFVGTGFVLTSRTFSDSINGNQLYGNVDGSVNRLVYVDPSYDLFYNGSCKNEGNIFYNNVTYNTGTDATIPLQRIQNLNLLTNFQYPIKFPLTLDVSNCLNANNLVQL